MQEKDNNTLVENKRYVDDCSNEEHKTKKQKRDLSNDENSLNDNNINLDSASTTSNDSDKENKNTKFTIETIDDLLHFISINESYVKNIRRKRNTRSKKKLTKSRMYMSINKLLRIRPALIKLNNMVGLTELKNQLLEQLLFFITEEDKNIMLHTVIEGPPGTGKTTVANLMAEIYSGMGILKKNKCTVVKREDLIGQYLGETTIKTQEMLDECKNGVMLIDEAYSLGSDDNRDSYAKEAIDCINQYLTENVDKIICIIAGYKEELDRCFFSQNKGLRRRFPWRFTINDFNVKELVQIFKDKINDSSLYLLESNIDDDYLISKFKKEYFKGNGGDIDNLISRIKIVNSRKKFLNNDYIIEKDTIEKSLEKFYDTKKINTNNNHLHMYL